MYEAERRKIEIVMLFLYCLAVILLFKKTIDEESIQMLLTSGGGINLLKK